MNTPPGFGLDCVQGSLLKAGVKPWRNAAVVERREPELAEVSKRNNLRVCRVRNPTAGCNKRSAELGAAAK